MTGGAGLDGMQGPRQVPLALGQGNKVPVLVIVPKVPERHGDRSFFHLFAGGKEGNRPNHMIVTDLQDLLVLAAEKCIGCTGGFNVIIIPGDPPRQGNFLRHRHLVEHIHPVAVRHRL